MLPAYACQKTSATFLPMDCCKPMVCFFLFVIYNICMKEHVSSFDKQLTRQKNRTAAFLTNSNSFFYPQELPVGFFFCGAFFGVRKGDRLPVLSGIEAWSVLRSFLKTMLPSWRTPEITFSRPFETIIAQCQTSAKAPIRPSYPCHKARGFSQRSIWNFRKNTTRK